MSHWNYRLIRHNDSEWGSLYSMHIIEYDDEGQPHAWCKAGPPEGAEFPEAHLDYTKMAEAFDHEAFEVVEGKLILERLHLNDAGLDNNGDVGV